MPPKGIKSDKKSAAAELKKKNTKAAESIVLNLKRNAIIDVQDVGPMENIEPLPKRAKKAEIDATESQSTKPRETNDAPLDLNRPKRTVSSTRKSRATDVSGKAAKNQSSTMVGKTDGTSSQTFEVTDSSGQSHKQDVEYVVSESSQKSKDMGASDRAAHMRTSKDSKRTVNNSTEKPKYAGGFGRASSASSFCYEIDCTRVSDTINVTDLQKHFVEHLKMNGKKNNLEENISILCRGDKVLINSKVFLPKRSLRFLCKKFLKKFKLIQVISSGKKSYQFKYVGTP